MPGAQAVRRTVESSSKIFDCVDVGTCGMLSVITTLEFFQHHFSEMGHRDLLVTQTYLTRQATNAPLPHAQRPPPGGYVQNGITGMWPIPARKSHIPISIPHIIWLQWSPDRAGCHQIGIY